MNNDGAMAPNNRQRLATGLGPYIFSLLIIIIPATAAYYFHLQSQTSYHQKRAFRALDEAGRLLDRNIGAFSKMYPRNGTISENSTENVRDLKKLKQNLSQYTFAIQKNPIFTDISARLISGYEKKSCTTGTAMKLGIKRDQGRFNLVQEVCFKDFFQNEASEHDWSQILTSTVSLNSLLADLRRRQEFDVIALVRSDGDVLYSTETERGLSINGRPGNESVSRTKNYLNINHLLQQVSCEFEKNGSKARQDEACQGKPAVGQAGFVEIKVGGATKLVFIQPYRPQKGQLFCAFAKDGCGVGVKEEGVTGYMVGIVDAGEFNNRVQNLSPNMVAAITLFVLIAMLLAPYLRIALSGPLASVSQLFTGYLLSSGVLSTGITIILLLWSTLGRSILETSENTAREIAINIEEDVRSELIERLETYVSLRGFFPWAQGDYSSARKGPENCPVSYSQSQGASYSYNIEYASGATDKGRPRPPYQVMFFAGEDGNSIDKHYFSCRTANLRGGRLDLSASKMVDVSSRKYFKDAFKNGLQLNRFLGASNTLPAFAIQRIMSFSTGAPATALAIPEMDSKISLPGEAKVGVISGPLLSLSAPVLPDGFHFAIIEDDTGLVVAHDNPGRVLVEDFFREADDNPDLLASILRRQGKAIHGKYHGRSSLFYTRSIQGIPWSVVVIHDRTIMQEARFEIAAIALGELLLIFLVIGICILSTIIFWQRLPWTWLWPMRRDIFDNHPLVFWKAITILATVLLVGVVVILSLSGPWMIYWTAVTMLSGAHLMYLVSIQPYDVRFFKKRRSRTPAVMVLAFFLLSGLVVSAHGAYYSNVISPYYPWVLCVIGLVLLWGLTVFAPNKLQACWDNERAHKLTAHRSLPGALNAATKTIVSEPLRRFRHVTAGVFCLLLFGGLPAGAAFKDAYTTYMDLLFRQTALGAAADIDRRVGVLRSYVGSLDQKRSAEEGLSWTKSYNFMGDDVGRGLFLGGDLLSANSNYDATSWIDYVNAPPRSNCSSESPKFGMPGLASFMISKAFPVDEGMARLHLNQSQCSDHRGWYWREEAETRTLHYFANNARLGVDSVSLDWMTLKVDPRLFNGYSSFHALVFIFLMVLYIAVLYLQVSMAGARLGGTRIPFILNRSAVPRPNEGRVNFSGSFLTKGLFFERRMVIRPTERHKYSAGGEFALHKYEIIKLDVATKHDFSRIKKIIAEDDSVEIRILHLSYLIDNAQRRREMLPLLECLVHENMDVKITILTDYNPLYRLTRPDAYRDDTSANRDVTRSSESLRWSGLLSMFAKEYSWMPRDNPNWLLWKKMQREGELTFEREVRVFRPDSKIAALLTQKLLSARKQGLYGFGDDIPAEDIISLASELGGAYYRKLWEECTHNERVLLHTLAAGRCVNTLNIEIISHLMRRGLVVMEPSLTLVNESFAEFILEAETPETYRYWQNDEQEKGAWQALRVPFMFLLFVPIAILLVVATEELSGGIALMAPILTVIPMLMKGFGLRSPDST